MAPGRWSAPRRGATLARDTSRLHRGFFLTLRQLRQMSVSNDECLEACIVPWGATVLARLWCLSPPLRLLGLYVRALPSLTQAHWRASCRGTTRRSTFSEVLSVCLVCFFHLTWCQSWQVAIPDGF